jgi:hypothetical protein
MFTKLSTVDELKEIFVELLMNHTDKITKVSPASATSGMGYGIGKLGQKAIKEVALVESHIFPDTAYGAYLDGVAENHGIAARFTASQSSTYVRLVGDPGTVYTQGVQTITGSHGVVFSLEESITIGIQGFAYIKVRSSTTGLKTNIDAITLNKITPVPTGHKYCINEYAALYGRDNEDDDLFRQRIKQGSNILARGTIAMLEQVFMKINNNVLKLYFQGVDPNGKVALAILTQNGIDLTTSEINDILLRSQEFLSMTELKPDNVNGYGLTLRNVSWQPIDVSARLELYAAYNPDDVRKEVQIRLSKYIDFRNWTKQKVEWDDLLGIVKGTPGVKYVLDNFFSPGQDVAIDFNKLPRMRGFLMLNPDGSLISDGGNLLNPIFYPQQLDFNYQKTLFVTL